MLILFHLIKNQLNSFKNFKPSVPKLTITHA